MPNMDELISKSSAKITKSDDEIWMSKIDLDHAYGQAKLSKEASNHYVFLKLAATSRDITFLKKVSTSYRTYQPFLKSTLIK